MRQRGIAAMFSRKDSDPSDYDGFWSANMLRRDTPVYRELCRTRPHVPRGFYLGSCTTMVSPGYLNVRRPDWRFGHPNELARWHEDPASIYYNRFFIDVRNPAFQQWAKEEIARMGHWTGERRVHPYTMASLDNVQVGHRALIRKRLPDHPHLAIRALDNPDSWDGGFLRYLAAVKDLLNSYGVSVAGNHCLDYVLDESEDINLGTIVWHERIWNRLVPLLDVIVTERPIGYDGEPMYRGDRWHRAIMRHLDHLNQGKQVWWIVKPDTWEEFQYLYCSWLMIWRENSEKQLQTYFHARPNREWGDWYTEYAGLGDPELGMEQLESGFWRRLFDRGTVYVNASSEVKELHRAQIPAGSGRIVRRD